MAKRDFGGVKPHELTSRGEVAPKRLRRAKNVTGEFPKKSKQKRIKGIGGVFGRIRDALQ